MPEQNLENIPQAEKPVSSPEQVSGSEQKVEQQAEQSSEQAAQAQSESAQPQVILPDDSPQAAPLVPNQEIVFKKVEAILADGMDKVFLTMDVASQAKFKAQGEQTTREIMTLLQKTKVKSKQVIELILNWLRIIPGVNKFYLEQEAKIKADRIMRVYEGKD